MVTPFSWPRPEVFHVKLGPGLRELSVAGSPDTLAGDQNSCLLVGIPVRRGNLSGVSDRFSTTW